MNNLIIFLVQGLYLFSGIVHGKILSDNDITNLFVERIIGGAPVVSTKEIPSMVSLSYTYGFNHICGGSLITPKHVLTAAHCLTDIVFDPNDLSHLIILANRTSAHQPEDTLIKVHLKNYTNHPEYNDTNKVNDISIIELIEPLGLTEQVATIDLYDGRIPVNTDCIVAGFGIHDWVEKASSEYLLQVTIPIITEKRCRIYLEPVGAYLYDGMMCAGYIFGKRDACDGDSGGPLICENKLGGVVSFGVTCGMGPGIYTNVSHYTPWIHNVIGDSARMARTQKVLAAQPQIGTDVDDRIRNGSQESTTDKVREDEGDYDIWGDDILGPNERIIPPIPRHGL